ncbi:MAG: hypothetical protein OXU79_08695 [Gemmatimonadota bacterium]|nr:hypothetical protein [Gemmatimonadota bacterium]
MAMIDPHVVALIYEVNHRESVNYDEAEPLVVDENVFRLEIRDKIATFHLKDHYADEDAARKPIEEYIREWESDVCLQNGPDYFSLRFQYSKIRDRNPPPPKPDKTDLSVSISSGIPRIESTLSVVIRPSRFPSPPSDVSFNPDVQTLLDRYMNHCRGHEPLTGMAYFCFTFLNYLGKVGLNDGTTGVDAAARYFHVSKKVLTTVSKLCSTKGGPLGARKQVGVGQDLTNEESLFLTEAAKKTIRRAAEKAKSPTRILTQITILDLPPI